MTYVFDIDDTICKTINRDYANSIPIESIIHKMQAIKLQDKNAWIIIHTARGMKSCNGDVKMAETKNRATMEEWLKRYNVPYNEILFGKPFADVYVDDKAVSAAELRNEGVSRYSGFSGADVWKIGNTIIKECENAKEQAEWYGQAERLLCVPEVYSQSFGKLFMEYIEGDSLYELAANNAMPILWPLKIITALSKFKNHKQFPNTRAEAPYLYADYIKKRGEAIGLPVDNIVGSIQKCTILCENTFCHGDLSMSNIIVRKRGRMNDFIYIDPSPKEFISHWLLDAAKFRASLNGLDAALRGKEPYDWKERVKEFDAYFTEKELDVIKLLEKTHYIRVAYYAQKLGKEKQKRLLIRLYNS